MDIGAEFDDDFFEQPKVKKESTPQNYEAKICVPLWFMEAKLAKQGVTEVLIALKHQADYHYYCKRYSKAAEIYKLCLGHVPASNNTWKREFMENLARSYLHMDEPQKALEWSLRLDRNSFSPDQKVVSMNLLATVCHRLGKYEEELEALHWCLEAHKSCPEFWLRLGLCYAGLFKLHLPEHSTSRQPLEQEPEACCAFKSKMNTSRVPLEGEGVTPSATVDSSADSAISCNSVPEAVKPELCSTTTSSEVVPSSKCDVCTVATQFVSSCLIHTKMLIDSGGANLLDIERDERIKRKIANSLRLMEVDQTFIDVASQMLGTNFLAQLQSCDNTLEPERESTSHENDREVPHHVV